MIFVWVVAAALTGFCFIGIACAVITYITGFIVVLIFLSGISYGGTIITSIAMAIQILISLVRIKYIRTIVLTINQTIGIVIISGVVVSTGLTLFMAPLTYSFLARFTSPTNRIDREIKALEQELLN